MKSLNESLNHGMREGASWRNSNGSRFYFFGGGDRKDGYLIPKKPNPMNSLYLTKDILGLNADDIFV